MQNYFSYYGLLHNILDFEKKRSFFPFSKNFGLIWHHILSYSILIAMTIGTFLPLFYSICFNKNISIGGPYFEENVLPIFLPLLFLMTIYSFSKKNFKTFKNYIYDIPYKEILIFFNLISIPGLIILAYNKDLSLIFILYVPFSILFLSFYFTYLTIDLKFLIPKNIAHLSFWLLCTAILISSIYEQEILQWMFPGDQIILDQYICTFRNIHEYINPNYYTLYGNFSLENKWTHSHLLSIFPEKRFYFSGNILNIKSIIGTSFYGDFYIMIGEGSSLDGWYTRIFFKPFMVWLWIGWIFLILSGVVSFFKNLKQLKLL